MIYVTSDIHYNHQNIASQSCSRWKSGYRDFNSLKDMNTHIEREIDKLTEKDKIYILGDLCFGDEHTIEGVIRRFKCPVYLAYGNHDKKIRNSPYLISLFKEFSPVLELGAYGKYFYMCHYAHRVWEKSHRRIHLYGHTHGTIPDYNFSMDVGFDTCGYGHKKYTFYTLKEIINIMKKRSTRT